MNCVEFERDLPEILEGGHTPEQQAHLDLCPACSSLVLDLNAISSQAKLLAASEEPSPAVWNALEARLRSEELIRRPEAALPRVGVVQRWRNAWLIPVAAALALGVGIKLYHPIGAGENLPVAHRTERAVPPVAARTQVSHEDQQWLDSVAARPHAQLARYRADLDQANSFIRDAEQSVKDDPNDIFAQQMLINAYEQKQMLYELAVDRSGQ